MSNGRLSLRRETDLMVSGVLARYAMEHLLAAPLVLDGIATDLGARRSPRLMRSGQR